MSTKPPDPIRTELYFGAVYGLGLSALIWAAVLFPPPVGAGTLGLLALALAAGLFRPRFRWIHPTTLVLPLALTSLSLAGLAAGVIAAAITGLTQGLLGGGTARARRRSAMFHAVAAAMAAFVAGLAYVAALGAFSGSSSVTGSGVAGLAHGLAFMALHRPLLLLAATHSRAVALTRSPQALRSRLLLAVLASPILAWPLIRAYGDPDLRTWVLLSAGVLLCYKLGRARAERRSGTRVRQERSLALQGAITRTLIKAISGGDRAAEQELWRVQGLCLAVGEQLELDDDSLEALGSAALLHDVGKIGVPEPILDKPGALTPHEMDSIRLHPVFGAEMLASIAFPTTVCEIVQHHHERWDGRGYPEGLVAQQIPVGARILAAVDNYDALTSPRPFRRAVPAAEARKHLRGEGGKMFDPEVIDVLLRLLEQHGERPLQRVGPVPALPGLPPAVEEAPTVRLPPGQQQLATLYELERVTRYPIDLDDCLRLAADRIAALVPHRSLAVYLLDDAAGRLSVVHAAGQGADALREVSLAPGERLSGWAVRHQRAIIGRDHSGPLQRDGARSDLENWLDDPRLAGLISTLAAPLVANGTCLGAVTLYDGPGREYSGDERRRLVSAAGHLARAVLRARRSPRAHGDGMTDRLTGLPDGRYLLLDAEERLATSLRAGTDLGFLAFQVSRTTEPVGERFGTETAESGLRQIARRLAEHCREHETLTRFGPDTFVVLSPLGHPDELLDRWNGFIGSVENRPLELPHDASPRARLVSASAGFPRDGEDVATILSTLHDRLDLAADRGATIVPFRATERSAG